MVVVVDPLGIGGDGQQGGRRRQPGALLQTVQVLSAMGVQPAPVALCWMRLISASADTPGVVIATSPASADTCGVAMDVPDAVARPDAARVSG